VHAHVGHTGHLGRREHPGDAGDVHLEGEEIVFGVRRGIRNGGGAVAGTDLDDQGCTAPESSGRFERPFRHLRLGQEALHALGRQGGGAPAWGEGAHTWSGRMIELLADGHEAQAYEGSTTPSRGDRI
jgi:hypothetical protein